jgi:hypothetical protein
MLIQGETDRRCQEPKFPIPKASLCPGSTFEQCLLFRRDQVSGWERLCLVALKSVLLFSLSPASSLRLTFFSLSHRLYTPVQLSLGSFGPCSRCPPLAHYFMER